MLTGYPEFEYARIALQHGVRYYIVKPINYEELQQTVSKLPMRSAPASRSKSKRNGAGGRSFALPSRKCCSMC